jgi:hypothetical protein
MVSNNIHICHFLFADIYYLYIRTMQTRTQNREFARHVLLKYTATVMYADTVLGVLVLFCRMRLSLLEYIFAAEN